jgi:hypothetical protein
VIVEVDREDVISENVERDRRSVHLARMLRLTQLGATRTSGGRRGDR